MEKMDPLYLEDLTVGQRFKSGTYVMDAVRIKEFAAEFDPQPFHLDEDAAQASVFNGLAARLAHRGSGYEAPCRKWDAIRERAVLA